MKSHYILKTTITSQNNITTLNNNMVPTSELYKILSTIGSKYSITTIISSSIPLILVIFMLISKFITISTFTTEIETSKLSIITSLICLILGTAFININHQFDNEMMHYLYQSMSVATITTGVLATLIFAVWALNSIKYGDNSLAQKMKLESIASKEWLIGKELMKVNIFSIIVVLLLLSFVGKTTFDIMSFIKNMKNVEENTTEISSVEKENTQNIITTSSEE